LIVGRSVGRFSNAFRDAKNEGKEADMYDMPPSLSLERMAISLIPQRYAIYLGTYVCTSAMWLAVYEIVVSVLLRAADSPPFSHHLIPRSAGGR